MSNIQSDSGERIQVLDGNEVLFQTPRVPRSREYSSEICIRKTTNDQYGVRLIGSCLECHNNRSLVEIHGVYDNVVYKGFLSSSSMAGSFSLYMPVDKSTLWHTSCEFSSGWYSGSFDDSEWRNVTSSFLFSDRVRYFRKSFVGLINMAAYEIRLKFRCGIVAYLNGVEIYRQNMPGDPSSSSVACFNESKYRGVVRSGREIRHSNVVAVALASSLPMNAVDFAGWIAIYASAVANYNCYGFPYPSTVVSLVDNSSLAMDYKSSTVDFLSFVFPTELFPVANAILWHSGEMRDDGAVAYQVGGSTEENHIHVMTFVGQRNDLLTIAPIYGATKSYHKYRLSWGRNNLSIPVSALSFGICNIAIPRSLNLSSYEVSAHRSLERVSLRVTTPGVTDCTISPSLPEGVTFSATSCSVSGLALQLLPRTVFTITSLNLFNASASFSLTVTECSESVVEVVRLYSLNAEYEAYRIVDLDTNETVVEELPSSGQKDNSEVSIRFCGTASRYRTIIWSLRCSWNSGSFVSVFVYVGNQREQILRCHYDTQYLRLPSSYVFNVHPFIREDALWYYKMGVAPDGWMNRSTEGWNEERSSLVPNSTNHIQLYKKVWTIDSLSEGGGFSLGIRYRYGCIVFLNGVEVFRNHLPEGNFTSEMVAEGGYGEVKFRFVTLPYRTIRTPAMGPLDYLKEGENVIAIALVGLSVGVPTSSVFDAVLFPFGDSSVSRLMDVTSRSEGMIGDSSSLWDLDPLTDVHSTNCGSNWIDIQFNDDRREWVSSVALQTSFNHRNAPWRSFKVLARNRESEPWTELVNASQLKWWTSLQEKVFFLQNNRPYNVYRFANFSSDVSDCSWYLNRVDLFADSITLSIPDLSYDSPLTAFLDVEMAEAYPIRPLYTNFQVTTPLPPGLELDPTTGVLLGTPLSVVTNYSFTISAVKLNGEETSFPMIVSVILCSNQYSLVTARMYVSSFPSDLNWTLYLGKGQNQSVVQQHTVVSTYASVLYADLCLEPDIYTFGLRGIESPSSSTCGYSLSIDIGSIRFDIAQLDSDGSPSLRVFSSFLPFQINHSEWTATTNSSLVDDHWKEISFDDSQWLVGRAASLNITEMGPLYVRKTFTIPNLDDYQVLNVRAFFFDGLAAYFNGKLVALFNMPDSFNPTTAALSSRDATAPALFHILLHHDGAVSGRNVIAFELHRSPSSSSAVPFSFDASGVFGVEQCSPVLDSFLQISASPGVEGRAADALDLSLSTVVQFPAEPSSIQWTVENHLGSRFNQLAFQHASTVHSLSYSFSGSSGDLDDATKMMEANETMALVGRVEADAPAGLVGFRAFRFDQQNGDSSTLFTVASFLTLYCKSSGAMCPGIDPFPSVEEGQISPASCPYGYSGYSYRICANGVLGEVKSELCALRVPQNLMYREKSFSFVMNTLSSSGEPSYEFIIQEFSFKGLPLPEGMELNQRTGEISGVPTQLQDVESYTIVGSNEKGSVATVISIMVRLGSCPAYGPYSQTLVGNTEKCDCRQLGSYVGSKSRRCVLGDTDGVWERERGVCIPIIVLVFVVAVCILIVFIIISVLLKVNKKKVLSEKKRVVRRFTKWPLC